MYKADKSDLLMFLQSAVSNIKVVCCKVMKKFWVFGFRFLVFLNFALIKLIKK